ncbi:MAG: hypothetical protein Q8P67_20700, partial [archaeon]|nr:hypothetical protein [archaeon]
MNVADPFCPHYRTRLRRGAIAQRCVRSARWIGPRRPTSTGRVHWMIWQGQSSLFRRGNVTNLAW